MVIAAAPAKKPATPAASPPNAAAPVAASDAIDSAKSAGLRYVTDDQRGITRNKSNSGFSYAAPDGTPLRDADELQRIKTLAIPPAWTDVWICARPNGHLQATGRDARGRKQYRYHARWRQVRDEAKYDRMLTFARLLPSIRKRTEADLALPGLPRNKVLATVVRLLETTLIRIGNEEYARDNGSFGLTTMRNGHVDVSGSTLKFEFRGKSGKEHSIGVRDLRLARIIKRLRELPGQTLFQYVDDAGDHQNIDSADVNDYLREITGQDFTAKDFRTWAGTVLAAVALHAFEPFETEGPARRNVVRAIEQVATRLGNTPTVCRKCYVHPAVIDAYLEGATIESLGDQPTEKSPPRHDLTPEEDAVLEFLQQRLDGNARAAN